MHIRRPSLTDSRPRFALLVMLFILADSPVYSQQEEASDKVLRLREVEVLSNRKLKDTGIEMTTIDTTLLHEHLSMSMADILTKNSTVFVKNYGRATESTAEFRGTSPSHTQVLWNGMRINSPMLGTVDFSYIPGYFVDEAILLHGASSITETGGGLGGSISLLSKPTYNRGHQLQYIQGIGSFHTYDQFLRYTFSNDRWSTSTRLSYGHSKNDFRYTNYDKKVDERDENGQITNSYHPTEVNKSGYFDDVNVLQDVSYRSQNGDQLSASLWYAYSLRGLPFLSVDYKDDADFVNEHKQNTLRSVLRWEHWGKKWKHDLSAGYSQQGINYNYYLNRTGSTTDITNSYSKSRTGYLKANWTYFHGSNFSAEMKAEAYYHHVHSEDRSPFHIGDNYRQGRFEESLSASLRWRPFSRFSLGGVVRQEVYGERFVQPIPALFTDVVLYRPWNLVLKASVARNYRYPSMDDLYFQPGGNPDLRPERGFTYDGGVEWGVKRQRWMTKGSITAFNSFISDWILWTPNHKGYWVPSNVKEVHNYGLEASTQSEWMIARDWKGTFAANFAYTPSINRGEDMNSNDASYGKQLCYVPVISVNFRAQLQWKRWSLTYQWVHYGRRYTTTSNEVGYITGELIPYFTSDVSLEKGFRWRRLDINAKLLINNLLDNEYQTVLSHPMPGRNFELFIEVKY